MSDTAQRLKEMRDRASYSQEAFAADGISQRKISYWESGQIPDALNVLAVLARRYGCSADYLLGLTDDPSPSDQSSEIQQIYNRLSIGRQRDLLDIAENWLVDESEEFRLEWMAKFLAEYGDNPAVMQKAGEIMDELLEEDEATDAPTPHD